MWLRESRTSVLYVAERVRRARRCEGFNQKIERERQEEVILEVREEQKKQQQKRG